MYFLADDKQGFADLWVTDGTTTEAVGGISDLGVAGSGQGLGPESLTIFGQQMIFGGTDSLAGANSNGLWLTDGTAGGTKEVGGVSPGTPNSSPFTFGNANGLSPTGFVTFGSKALFFGTDASGFTGLWVTDGTVGKTTELGGLENGQIVGKGANLSPENLTAFNNSVLFDAYDSGGFQGLWITDGTTAGTVEIGGLSNQGIADSGTSSFVANDFTTLGTEELFNAPDAEGDAALWITDGSAIGTKEIGGQGNMGVIGALNTDLGDGLAQSVKFGNRIFFAGADNDGSIGLWATDGTATGTTEIGGLSDAGLTTFGQKPNIDGLHPTDLTVNGPQLLFDGDDSLGFKELWVTDGAAPDTTEVGGLGDAGLTDVASNGLDPHLLTSLGNGKAVFIGYDNSNNQNQGKATLWVTDGTAGGTQEIGGLDNLQVANANSSGLNPQDDLMGSDGIAYFTGEDAAGQYVLWETDGTASGTKVIAATDGNAPATGISPANMALGPVPSSEPPSAADDLPQDLTNVSYSSSLDAQYNPVTGTLHILNAAQGSAIVATIALSGAALAGVLVKLAGDGSGGTLVSLTKFPSLTLGTGDRLISGIKSQAYIGYRAHYIGKLLTEIDYFYQPTGQPFQFDEQDFTGGTALLGTKYYYTNISGKNYTGSEVDFDGGGNLTRAAYTGVKNSPYSSFEFDYNVGILTGLKFTLTDTPIGATYSAYETDYDSQFNYEGLKLFYDGVTGKSYTDEEIDVDTSNQITAVILTGVTGSPPYDKIEEDFTGGVYSGAELYNDSVTGQAYGAVETDVNAAGVLEKAIYTGLTGSAETAVEYDYSVSGSTSTLLDTIATFGNIQNQNYYEYSIKDNSSGTQVLWTIDYDNGSHRELGSSAFQDIYSLGNDKMTGGGFFDGFILSEGFGHCEITDFWNHIDTSDDLLNLSDAIFVPKADWATVSLFLADAKNSGANVVVTAGNGDTLTIDNMTTTTLQADSGHIVTQ
jgi:ELWxxDGT repeat protein